MAVRLIPSELVDDDRVRNFARDRDRCARDRPLTCSARSFLVGEAVSSAIGIVLCVAPRWRPRDLPAIGGCDVAAGDREQRLRGSQPSDLEVAEVDSSTCTGWGLPRAGAAYIERCLDRHVA